MILLTYLTHYYPWREPNTDVSSMCISQLNTLLSRNCSPTIICNYVLCVVAARACASNLITDRLLASFGEKMDFVYNINLVTSWDKLARCHDDDDWQPARINRSTTAWLYPTYLAAYTYLHIFSIEAVARSRSVIWSYMYSALWCTLSSAWSWILPEIAGIYRHPRRWAPVQA